jgi:hypothetical protein
MWNVLRLYIHLYYCINWKNHKLTLYVYTVIQKLMGLHIAALVFSLDTSNTSSTVSYDLLLYKFSNFVVSSVHAGGLCSHLTQILRAIL